MADYSLKVASVRMRVDYDEEPPAIGVQSLSTLVSRQLGEYTTSSPAHQFSNQIAGLPYLAAADLAASSRWLVHYNVCMGCDASPTAATAEAYLASGGIDFAHGKTEVNFDAVTIPRAARGQGARGWFMLEPTGSDLLFAIRAVSSKLASFENMHLAAIPLDDLVEATQATNGVGDYFLGQTPMVSGDVDVATIPVGAGQTYTPVDLVSARYYPGAIGNYVVLSSAETTGGAAGDGSRLILYHDTLDTEGNIVSSTMLRDWQHRYSDIVEMQPMNYAGRVSLGGQNGQFRLEAHNGTGLSLKHFRRPRVFVLRLDSFKSYATAVGVSTPLAVNVAYPGFEVRNEIQYTPSAGTSGENVLVIGDATAYRPDVAYTMSRIRNATTDQVLSEFTSDKNHFTGFDFDRGTVVSASIESANAPNTYTLEFAGQQGLANNSLVVDTFLCAIGLTIDDTTPPTTHVLNLSDTMDVSNADAFSGPDLPGPITLQDVNNPFDQFSVSVQGAPTVILPHPRIWHPTHFDSWVREYNGGAPTDIWNNSFNTIGQGRPFENGLRAIRYMVTGSQADLDAVLANIDSRIGYLDTVQDLRGGSSYQAAGPFCFNWCCVYDWLYDELGPTRRKWIEDVLLAIVYLLYHESNDQVAIQYGHNNAGTNTAKASYTNNPNQNFFTHYLYDAMMVGIALHPNPTTFRYPWVTGTEYAFNMLFNADGGQPGPQGNVYTNIIDFVNDKLDTVAYPVWDTYMKGGSWNEGNPYGIGVLRRMLEAVAAWKSAGARRHIDQNPLWKSMVRYMIYVSDPRNTFMAPFGEAAGSTTYQPVTNYVRHAMLVASSGMRGSLEGQWAQYWCENVYPLMTNNQSNDNRQQDVLWFDSSNESRDYKLDLPTDYVSEGNGMVSARSSWDPDATWCFLLSGPFIQNHDHSDKGQVCIYKAVSGAGTAGMSVTDGILTKPPNGDRETSHYHNTYVAFEPFPSINDGTLYGLNTGWFQPFSSTPHIERYSTGNGEYTYGRGVHDDLYWTTRRLGSSQLNGQLKVRQITEIFDREFFFIQSGAYLVVFDRLRVTDEMATSQTVMQARWHWFHTSPESADPARTIFRHDNALGGRVYHRVMNNTANSGLTNYNGIITLEDVLVIDNQCDMWRAKIDVPMASQYNTLLNVFEIPDTPSKAAMSTTYPSQERLFGGTHQGVTIQDSSAWKHVLFSREQDGAVPAGTIEYYVWKNAGTDIHYVANLTPLQEYFVEETLVSGVIYKYTLVPTSVIGFVADSGGVVRFRPDDLGGQSESPPIEVQDAMNVANIDSMSFVQSFVVDKEDTMNVANIDSIVVDTPGRVTVQIQDTMDLSAIDSMATPRFGLQLKDTISVGDEEFSMESIGGVPGVVYVEKRIMTTVRALNPNGDAGSSFIAVEPTSSALWEAVRTQDDGDYITFNSFNAGLAFFELDDPTGYIGRIRSANVRIRLRSFSSGSAGLSRFDVFLVSGAKTFLTRTLPIGTIAAPVNLETGVVAVNISKEDARSMILKIRLLGTGPFSGVSYPEVSYIEVAITGDPSEKVITG